MKAERKQEAFSPILITLETQEEVDKLFALLNYVPLAAPIDISTWWIQLRDFKTGEYIKYYKIIDNLIERKK